MNEHLPPADNLLAATAAKVVDVLKARLTEAAANFKPGFRPVAAAAGALLSGTLDIPAEVKRIIGVDLDPSKASTHKPILLVASKFGVWASELTLVAGTLLKAGYQVKIATEDGSPPHFLSPSLDPDFADGAWRCPVVSIEEKELALKFLNPSSPEHTLLLPQNILDLSKLVRPPQVGDYFKDPSLLDRYAHDLPGAMGLANDYDAIVIAGGSGAIPGLMDDRGFHNLILAFFVLGKPVVGQCNGGLAIAQTIDPSTKKSILNGRAVTTHSWLDEFQSGWGWTGDFKPDITTFWNDGRFDLAAYSKAETWDSPGRVGNPMIDSEGLFENAAGPEGTFFSPAGTPYSVVVDGNLITCRTTPDGYPGVLALLAVMDGKTPLAGPLFIDADAPGRPSPAKS